MTVEMATKFPTRLLNLPFLAYADALELMRRLVEKKRRSHFPEVLIFLEHEPVLTLGRRGESSDILVPDETLVKEGIAVHRVERGGLITYHGPGQLVVYPIFDLERLGLAIPEFVYKLEEIILNTLSEFDINAQRISGKRGVWVGREKIASIGVAIQGGISFHGLALNVHPNLDHFDLINPCGLNGVRMTSIKKILGATISSTELRQAMARHFTGQFNLDLKEWPLE